jgi:hypothetical protein
MEEDIIERGLSTRGTYAFLFGSMRQGVTQSCRAFAKGMGPLLSESIPVEEGNLFP